MATNKQFITRPFRTKRAEDDGKAELEEPVLFNVARNRADSLALVSNLPRAGVREADLKIQASMAPREATLKQSGHVAGADEPFDDKKHKVEKRIARGPYKDSSDCSPWRDTLKCDEDRQPIPIADENGRPAPVNGNHFRVDGVLAGYDPETIVTGYMTLYFE